MQIKNKIGRQLDLENSSIKLRNTYETLQYPVFQCAFTNFAFKRLTSNLSIKTRALVTKPVQIGFGDDQTPHAALYNLSNVTVYYKKLDCISSYVL